jgi:hypothetical protein
LPKGDIITLPPQIISACIGLLFAHFASARLICRQFALNAAGEQTLEMAMKRMSLAARVNRPLVCSSGSMSRITPASRDHIADEKSAFPRERKEPIHDAAHVRKQLPVSRRCKA